MLNQVIPKDAALHNAENHTVEQVAAAIQYHPESVRRAIRQGRIHALPFGQSWRIPASEVRRILTTGLPYRAGGRP